MKISLLLLFIIGIVNLAAAQEKAQEPLGQAPVEQVQRMNSIKLEFTQPLYSKSLVFSFERVTKPNQTFCITGGYEEFPQIVELGDDIRVNENLDKGGYKLGGEYRFYLAKENKYLAPHGVYIGPYVSYHDFNNKRTIEVNFEGTPEVVELQCDFRMLNIGVELGYQFVINNRWTIDIVAVGPSVSNYRANAEIDGNFTFDKGEVEDEILLKLLERFPLLEDVLTDKEASASGRLDKWAYGWRYQFLIGYHFGGKKK